MRSILARDTRLKRNVALKVLPPGSVRDESARIRLKREAQTASALNNPCICTIYEAGEADGQIFIAMEYVTGQTLSVLIPPEGLPPESVVSYGMQISEALEHAHDHGVIHRDLKASNVIITPEARVKVLDFGLAERLASEDLAETTRSQLSLAAVGKIAGTLPYMSPEVLRGQPADARADIWALGAVLYEMASGRRPFHGSTAYELTSAILRDSPPALPGHIPAGLRAVIFRCLMKEPLQRYKRASEVRAALEAAGSGAVVPSAEAKAHVIRSRWFIAVLVVTGNFTFGGNVGWNGVVLIVGQGKMTAQGGGNNQFNGAALLANTRGPCPTNDWSCPLLPNLGPVTLTWAGGGGNGVYYNTCLINNSQNRSKYRVISFREIEPIP